MRKYMSLLIFLLLPIIGCSQPSHYQNQFFRDREAFSWSLSDYTLDLSADWDLALTNSLADYQCSPALLRYLLYSSDQIESYHTLDLEGMSLDDNCLALALIFMRDVLHQSMDPQSIKGYQINIAGNVPLTDRSIAHLIEMAKSIKEIKKIDLRGNTKISDDAIHALKFESQIKVIGG